MKYSRFKIVRAGIAFAVLGMRADTGDWRQLVTGFKRAEDAMVFVRVLKMRCAV